MHDPRIGRFFATDPLEAKYPFYSPYQFSGNSPIVAVELEGLESSKNVNKNEVPQQNIYIVIDYNKDLKKEDQTRDKIVFEGMKEAGWKGIYAKNFSDGNEQLAKYLKGTQPKNVVLETHGATVNGTEERAVLADSNINTGIFILSSNLQDNLNGICTTNQSEIDGLIGIVNQTKSGGKFYLNACNVAEDDNFIGNLQLLTDSRVDMYANSDKSTTTYFLRPNNTGAYTPSKLFNVDVIQKKNHIDGAKFYPKGWSLESEPIKLFNMRLNNNGIVPIYNKPVEQNPGFGKKVNNRPVKG